MTNTTIPDILTKKALIVRVSEECGTHQVDSRMFIDAFIKILEETVEYEKKFKVSGLGEMLYSHVPPRTTSTFDGKGTVDYPPTTKVLFKLSPTITKRIK